MIDIRKILKILAITVAIVAGIAVACFAACAAVVLLNNQYYLPITLQGEREITVEYGSRYEDAGATAQFYGTLLHTQPEEVPVTATTEVNTRQLGVQLIKYVAKTDKYLGTAYRKVRVVDTTPPEIVLNTDPNHVTLPGEAYQEEGYTATDHYDGDLTEKVAVRQKDNVVYYTVSDSSGNVTTVQREIVYEDAVAPVIALNGNKYITVITGEKFQDPGYLAADNLDGDLTKKVKVSGKVNTKKVGVYTLKYAVKDNSGNPAAVSRKVIVTEEGPNPRNPEYPKDKVIYLTFDDGPGPYTGKLLDILKRYDVKATFFVTEKPEYYDMITRAHKEGHTVAMHTMSHTYKEVYASSDAYYQDLYGMQDIIKELTGETATLLRFPGGSSNTVSKKYCEGLMSYLANDVVAKGFQYFDWNVDSNDAGGARSANEVFRNVINGIRGKNYAVVLQHDIKEFSVDAVEKIIQWGLENGYQFKPLTPVSPTCQHNIRN